MRTWLETSVPVDMQTWYGGYKVLKFDPIPYQTMDRPGSIDGPWWSADLGTFMRFNPGIILLSTAPGMTPVVGEHVMLKDCVVKHGVVGGEKAREHVIHGRC
jgi:hypothetical protein